MPFQLERRGQCVHAFIQQLHYAIVAAIDDNSADPHRARRFNLHKRTRRRDAGSTYPSKTFLHQLEKPRPIIAPLILIIVCNEIGNSLPISTINGMKEMSGVQTDLMLRSPKPQQIYADSNKQRHSAKECSTKCNPHIANLLSR